LIKPDVEFDPEKSRRNREKHGVGLDDFSGFDGEFLVIPDARLAYGEERFRAFGRIGGLGYMVVFTQRGERNRLISFRRAHDEEMQLYGR
jgi:uncharacterized DUF497 family protein